MRCKSSGQDIPSAGAQSRAGSSCALTVSTRRPCSRTMCCSAQDALLASLQTLEEVKHVSIPPSAPWRRERGRPPPPTLQRFVNLREVTLDGVYARGHDVLPALPVSVEELTLSPGLHLEGCAHPLGCW